jgi:hypothetical protein
VVEIQAMDREMKIELAEDLANEAEAAGLLNSGSIADLLRSELARRRQIADAMREDQAARDHRHLTAEEKFWNLIH